MKYLKTVGLTAVAALAFMAFVGLGTASATTLCKTGTPEESVCGAGAGKKKTSATDESITASSTNSKLTGGSATFNISCTSSSTTVTATGNSGTTVPGEVTALSFTGCSTESGITCTNPSVKNLPYPGSIEAGTGGDSKLKTEKGTEAEPKIGASIVCGGFVSCEFLTNKAELTGTNGSPTNFVAKEVNLPKKSGLFCPSAAKWDGTYNVTSPAGFTVLP